MTGLDVLTEGVHTPIREYKEADTSLELNERIKNIINSGNVVLFMKGNASAAQCGFSYSSIEILKSMNVPFTTFDILSSSEIRSGLKEFSGWNTYPQIYINGELIGGNDILVEMKKSGELGKMLESL
jgi:monothiol glutaredoxin